MVSFDQHNFSEIQSGFHMYFTLTVHYFVMLSSIPVYECTVTIDICASSF